MNTPSRPPGRYDEPRALPRPVLIALAVLGLLALTAGAWWAFERSRADRVAFGITGYEVLSDSAVSLSFDVVKPAGRDAECRAEAQDRNGTVVGSALVRVGAGARVQQTAELTTTARATTAIVTGCRLAASPTPGGP